uniref:G protein-coupled receptor n=2 Tax=Bursaphelenchus xylophilus TaxID=6326 RepID=A0A1I7SHX1_BURXY
IVEIRAGKMWFITTGPFIHSGYPYNMLMSSLYLSGMYVTIMTIMVQFVYRYEVLCKNTTSMKKFFKLYALGIIWSVVQGFLTWPCFDPPSEEDTAILKSHPMYTFDTPTYVNGDVKNLSTMIHFTSSQVVIILLYVVVVITGRRIHKVLNSEQVKMSKNTRDAQSKLTTVMLLQATYPGIIVGTPVFIGCGMAQMKMDVLWSGMYFVTSISFIPIANALTVLLVIPSFRRRIFRKTGRKLTDSSGVSARSIGESVDRRRPSEAYAMS